MEKSIRYLTVYTIGSIGYGTIEVLYRGFTHWSMLITGGLCFISMYKINERVKPFLLKCLCGSGAITALEFTVGITVNKLLKLNVWDYSHLPFNVMGQISLVFSGVWFLLCIPAMPLCERLRRHFAETVKT